MKHIYLFTIVACLLMVSSCCVTRTTSITQMAEPITNDIIADLDVRSTKSSETYVVKVKSKASMKDEELKSNAVYQLLKRLNADVLVAPQFNISREKCQKTIVYTVEVNGYPAYYTNFRQMPMAASMELRELREGASYVIVKKSAANDDLEYDKKLIVVPVKPDCKTLDLDETTLETVVLKGKGSKARPAECEKEQVTEKAHGWKPATTKKENKQDNKKYSYK